MLDYLIDDIDLVLVMSVNPGFGGQSFISSQLRKIEAVRKMIDKTGRDIRLEVDGGVDVETARLCVDAGADVLVAGTATFRAGRTAMPPTSRRSRGGLNRGRCPTTPARPCRRCWQGEAPSRRADGAIPLGGTQGRKACLSDTASPMPG
jgi:hypothetical protein